MKTQPFLEIMKVVLALGVKTEFWYTKAFAVALERDMRQRDIKKRFEQRAVLAVEQILNVSCSNSACPTCF